ncbi:MAG: DNA repair protein RadC [Eubacteriales bacterium]|jgi:DNA repair protein RadC
MSNNTMKNLPEDEGPYEKCLQYGARSLTDAELLSVILRTGTKGRTSLMLAEDIMKRCRFDNGLTGLLHLTVPELEEIPGVGRVKACQIMCIGELSQRISRTGARKLLDFRNPSTIADYYMERLRHEEQEVVICMMLDTKNHLLGEREMTRGTVNQSLVSPRELFLSALSYHAVQMILVHNHPSGDPAPSREDMRITQRVFAAGRLIGIMLIDHIIIGDRRYTSFVESGLMDEIVENPDST